MVLRVDYFENYAGRFLSVEAKNRQGGATPTGSTYTGPSMSLSWNTGAGTPIDTAPRPMGVNIDPDTTPDTYIEHRELVRIGDAGSGPPRPTRIRVGSSTGAMMEADVDVWLGGGLPPMGHGYLKDFTTRYMDPTEVYAHFDQLAAEFPNISELITLPHKTNGYQRKAQANMSGTLLPGNAPQGGTAQSQTVVLTSRAWGHEGGNDISAEFRNPSTAELAAERGRGRPGDRRQPRHQRGRGAVEHGGRRGQRDQRRPGGARPGGGAHLPRERGRRHRAAAR